MSYIAWRDFLIEVQKGKVPGHTHIHEFGSNPTIANGVWELVSLLSGAVTFLTAATTVRIKAGGNVNDTAAGTGARSVRVAGIDDSLADITEDLATAGASASSATSASFWRVHDIYLPDDSMGAYGASNAGNIILENSAGGTDLIEITTGSGRSESAQYTIPTGKTGYLFSAFITVDSTQSADFRMLSRAKFNDTSVPVSPIIVELFWGGISQPFHFDPRAPLQFAALTDIWFEAEGAGGATAASVDFEILLVDD